ncbi:MAG: tRNA guanosine(34) transglycosylase Tgt, partial [Planctomycetota bacterium]
SDSQGRRGVLRTEHGVVETPVFMPVGTSGAVKGIWPRHIEEVGSTIILANTYHLLLRPGVDVIEQMGGLHKFMGWDKPILTDSGGYQVFSLNSLTRINDKGVEFSSHVDGQKFRLNAEIATDIQNRLGADIIMCFDQCTEYPCEQEELNKAVERTIKWAGECKKAHKNNKQLLFGIVQGGVDLELRKRCAEELVEMDFDGYAIGGLSVGEGHENMVATTTKTTVLLPEEKPRYLMGVGMPADIIAGVKHGVDMFDCVLPTRNGRNAFAFTDNGPVRLRNSIHITDSGPVEERCDCYCCSNFSRSAVRHFFNVGEMLGPILLSIHNLRFFQRLTQKIREKIEVGEFAFWADDKIEQYLRLYS